MLCLLVFGLQNFNFFLNIFFWIEWLKLLFTCLFYIWQAKNIVTAMHSCFNHTALDYAFQVKFCCDLTALPVGNTHTFIVTVATPGRKFRIFCSPIYSPVHCGIVLS